MKNRLSRGIMLLAAMAIMISLVIALAPDASAQDSRPAAKGVEATTYAIPVGFTPKTCCITIMPGATISTTEISPASAASSNPYSSLSRWFCMGYQNGNNP